MDTTPGTLFTLGYRGRRLSDFAELLPADTLVVDVRYKAWSPAPQWQPKGLREGLTRLGLRYLAAPGLGNTAYKTGGIVIAHPAEAAVLADLIHQGQTAALLCACEDVADCHRLTVAALILAARPDIPVVHLGHDSRKDGPL